MGMMYVDKPCQSCGIALTHVHFATKFCPTCAMIRQKESNRQAIARRAADPVRHARVNAMKHERYMKNREEILAKAKAYRQEHPEEVKAWKRRYAAKQAQRAESLVQAKKQPEVQDQAVAMLKAAAARRAAQPDRSAFRTVMTTAPKMRECSRLHLRSTTLPCGVDMDVCRGCPCLPA